MKVALLLLFPALAAAFASVSATINFAFDEASTCGDSEVLQRITTTTSEALGLSVDNVDVKCLSTGRRLQDDLFIQGDPTRMSRMLRDVETSTSSATYTVTIKTTPGSKERTKAALVKFIESDKPKAAYGLHGLSSPTVDGIPLSFGHGNFVEECAIYHHETCSLTPDHIRVMCEGLVDPPTSYNPTVGVDSVSGGVKATNTFPLAPGIATRNSAVNFLKGTGYDSANFGKDILKYTFSANKLWSVGERNYALPDTVSVYTADTSCSLETQIVTSAVASSAAAASSESTRSGKGYKQEGKLSMKEGGVGFEMNVKTQLGFGKSSANEDYKRSASQGLDMEYRIVAKAVSFTATIDTSALTTCDMNEFFVNDVLHLARLVQDLPTDNSMMEFPIPNNQAYQAIDELFEEFGTHIPTKFELGCEVERSTRFSSSMGESAQQESMQNSAKKGFSYFGFSSSTESSTSESNANAKRVSSQEAQGSTKVTCGSQSGTLDDFCDSVVMNNDQSHIPKMLSVDQLVPIWKIVEQVDPWVGGQGRAGSQTTQISKLSITQTAELIEKRFETRSNPANEAACSTAGYLEPPSEPGICGFDGAGWDCSDCSCYNMNEDPTNPLATPISSCRRSVCKPEKFTEWMPSTDTMLGFKVWTTPYPITKVGCNKMCLNFPVTQGQPCHGFYFKPYEDNSFTAGKCELYSKTFSRAEIMNGAFVDDSDADANYFQYTPRKNGCDVNFDGSKVMQDTKCDPGGPDPDLGQHTQFTCFALCGAKPNSECMAATWSAPSTCKLYKPAECTNQVEASGNVTKSWCGRAAPYEPEPQFCSDNNRYYFCGGAPCNEEKTCETNKGLKSCACPEGVVPFPKRETCEEQGEYLGTYYLCGHPGCDKSAPCGALEYCACGDKDADGKWTPATEIPDTIVDGSKQKCEADGLWYSCADMNCNLQRECASDLSLYDCACPRSPGSMCG